MPPRFFWSPHMQRTATFKLPNDMLSEIEREVATQPQHELPLLNERQTTHGSFEDNAIISQSFKRMFRAGPGWNTLSDIEREAMDMIALKFSRILSSRSLSKQHWEDVVGYAKLVEEKCF